MTTLRSRDGTFSNESPVPLSGQLRPGSGWLAGLAPIMEEGDLLDRQIISGTSTGTEAEDLLEIPRISTEVSLQDATNSSAPYQVRYCIVLFSLKCLWLVLSVTQIMQAQYKPLGRGLLRKQKILAKKEQKIEARRQRHLEWIVDAQEKQLEVSASLLTHRLRSMLLVTDTQLQYSRQLCRSGGGITRAERLYRAQRTLCHLL